MKHTHLPLITMGLLFLITQIIALILAVPFKNLGVQAFKDPDDPTNPIFYLAFLIVFTGIILLIVKYAGDKPVKYIFLFAMGFTMFYVFLLIFVIIYPYYWVISGYYIDIQLISALAIAILLTYILHKHPEWYVINTTGLIVGAGAIAILGNSFGILPCFILLIGLAIYDALSVYKTKHMLALADTAIDMKLPLLLVVPKEKGYSFIKQTSLDLHGTGKGEKKEREAIFMGLGDVIIPGVLVVSSYVFLPVQITGGIFAPFGVAVSTMLGGFIGYILVMTMAARGNPQAGLPFLNSGAILGYATSYVLLYRNYTLGMY